jgi:hypothetical protein
VSEVRPSDLIYGILLPALIAGVVLMAGGRGTPLAVRPRPLLGAIAIGAGYLVAQTMIAGRPHSPFAEGEVPARDWIAWLVLAAIALAPLRESPAFVRWSGPLYLALFSVLVFRLTLAHATAAGGASLAVRGALTVALYAAWNVLDRVALRSSGAALPIGLVTAGSGIALCALAIHVAVLAQLAGAVTAGLCASVVLGWVDKGCRLPIGAVAVTLIVFAGVLAITSVYGLPLASALLLVAAILAPCATEIGRLHALPPAKRALIALVASAVPAAIAVLIAQGTNSASDA